jgi:hypothetical protein
VWRSHAPKAHILRRTSTCPANGQPRSPSGVPITRRPLESRLATSYRRSRRKGPCARRKGSLSQGSRVKRQSNAISRISNRSVMLSLFVYHVLTSLIVTTDRSTALSTPPSTHLSAPLAPCFQALLQPPIIPIDNHPFLPYISLATSSCAASRTPPVLAGGHYDDEFRILGRRSGEIVGSRTG